MTICFVGESWGEQEAKLRSALVGPTGIELLKMLDEAQILSLTSEDWAFISRFWKTYDPINVQMIWNMHPEIKKTNVFNLRPPGNKLVDFVCSSKATAIPGYPFLEKGKYVHYRYQAELDRLAEELCTWNPNLIVSMGNPALWALCGKGAISKNRGTTCLSTHTVSGFKVLPIYHPAAVLRQWELRPTTVLDLMKAKREMGFSELRRPPREIWIEPTLEDIYEFTKKHICTAKTLSVDIETSGTQITCVGFASDKSTAIVIPFTDARRMGRNYWPSAQAERLAWQAIKDILSNPSPPKLFQNGAFDIAFLWRAYGIKVYGAEHDTMLLHHSLQPESLKGLGFLGSIYTNEGSWKQMRGKTDTIKAEE